MLGREKMDFGQMLGVLISHLHLAVFLLLIALLLICLLLKLGIISGTLWAGVEAGKRTGALFTLRGMKLAFTKTNRIFALQ